MFTKERQKSRSKYVIIEDPAMRDGFVEIPVPIARLQGLTPAAKLIYGQLLQYLWDDAPCSPLESCLAEDLGLAIDSVHAALDDLISKGLLRVCLGADRETVTYDIRPWWPEEVLSVAQGR